MSPKDITPPATEHPTPPAGMPPKHQETTAIRAATGEGRDAADDRPIDAPAGVARDADPSRDFKVAGSDEPHDSIDREMARARAATAAGKPVGTTSDPNSVTTGTEVE